MKELWLVCEGDKTSVDAAVLQPIFTRVLPAEIVIEPAGGSSVAAVAEFIQRQRGGQVAYVIDRDYRRREQAEESFRDGTNGFMWRRHSIENYLLPPAIIVRAFERIRNRFAQQLPDRVPKWVTDLPTDPDQVADGLRQCARQRAPEEACRLAIHNLWEDLSTTAGRVQKRVPSLSSGHASQDMDGWREGLRQESRRLLETTSLTVHSPQLDTDAIVRRFDEIYASLVGDEYVAKLRFQFDFHGRDLLKEFRSWLEQFGIRFKYERIVQELIDAAVEIYARNRTIYESDDFLDLANGVRGLAGLPALT